jgi:hypothetical protein
MVSLVLIKPDFVYDHNKKLYREFGTTEGKTIFSMPALAVGIAILLVLLFNLFDSELSNKFLFCNAKFSFCKFASSINLFLSSKIYIYYNFIIIILFAL